MSSNGNGHPRLRPLEIFPTEVKGQPAVCLRDPSGLSERIAILPRAGALAAILCDGTRSVADVADELSRRLGGEVPLANVAELIDHLDDAFLLDSPRFAAHRRAVHEAFRDSPRRPAAHAGQSYPETSDELERFLAEADAAVAEVTPAPVARAGLVAPHIDFHRGAPMYSLAYRALSEADRPDLVVVFGTDHNGADHPFTLTRKAYDTPFGAIETDVDLVDHLAGVPGVGDLFADEFHHRGEHSIEFQAVWLRRRFGARTPPMLPILCGSLHRHVAARESPSAEPRVREFLTALGAATRGRRILVVAGADLAHVGPRFGDGPMGSDGSRRTVAAADDAALRACARGDAEAFFAAVAAENDKHRICGLAPIYATLTLIPGKPGQVLGYDQCPADEKDESFVSIAAVAY